MLEDISPCRGCINTKKGIIECRDICERLKAYQNDLPYEGIEAPQISLGMDVAKKPEDCRLWAADCYENILKPTPEMHEEETTEAGLSENEDFRQRLKQSEETGSGDIAQPKDQIDKQSTVCLYCGSTQIKCKELCSTCYQAWYRGRIIHPLYGVWEKRGRVKTENKDWPVCEVDGCNEPGDKRGLCGKHYKQWNNKIISHPSLGEYFIIRPQKNSRDVRHRRSKQMKIEINFDQYQALFKCLKKISDASFLPVPHVIINLLSDALKTIDHPEKKRRI